MKKIIRLTEQDLTRIVRRVIREQGPFAPGMGPSTKSTTPPGVNPGMKKPNLQPVPKLNFKVGDVYEFSPEFYDASLTFKITSKEGEMFNGTVMGVFGKEFTEAEADEGFRAPKVGDPIKLEFDNQPIGLMDEFTFYLPKTAGMEELGGSLSDLKKLN